MSSIRSIPRMRAIPATGIPKFSAIVASTIRLTPGVPGAPIEDATMASEIIIICAKAISIPAIWAKNISVMA